jgi:hypothetical protein
VDPIKIRCTDSSTLQSRTCERPIVFQPLGARNQYRATSLWSSWHCYNKECKKHSAHLNKKCERFSVKYEKLRKMFMDIRS